MRAVLVALAVAALVGAVCCTPPGAVPAVNRWLTTFNTAYPQTITMPSYEDLALAFADFKMPAAPELLQYLQDGLSSAGSSCTSILAAASSTYQAGIVQLQHSLQTAELQPLRAAIQSNWVHLLAYAVLLSALAAMAFANMRLAVQLKQQQPAVKPEAVAAAAAAEPSPLAVHRGLMARLAERPELLVNTMPLLGLAARPELMEDVQQCNVVGLLGQLSEDDIEGICSIQGVNFFDNPTVDKKNNATPEPSAMKKAAKRRSVAIALVLLHRMTAAEAGRVCDVLSGALVAGSFGDACKRIYRSENITDVWEAVLDPVYSSVFGESLATKNVQTAAFLLVSKLLNNVL